MFEARVEQRFHVPSQDRGLHDHRVSAGKKDARYFCMISEVFDQGFGLPCGEFELVDAHELSPSKAVGAIRVTGLSRGREEQDRFRILVLYTQERFSIVSGTLSSICPAGWGFKVS